MRSFVSGLGLEGVTVARLVATVNGSAAALFEEGDAIGVDVVRSLIPLSLSNQDVTLEIDEVAGPSLPMADVIGGSTFTAPASAATIRARITDGVTTTRSRTLHVVPTDVWSITATQVLDWPAVQVPSAGTGYAVFGG